jgi:hypothetical protein
MRLIRILAICSLVFWWTLLPVDSASANGTISGTVNENGTLNLTPPQGYKIGAIQFASYGTPVNFQIGSCHANNSYAKVQQAINNNSLSIVASNNVFGDPCSGVGKRLSVILTIEPLVIQRSLAAPTNLQGQIDGSTATVNWSAPVEGNTPVERYAIFWSYDNWASGWAIASTTLSASIPNIPVGTQVQIKVRADNDSFSVYSDWSNEINLQETATPQPEPTESPSPTPTEQPATPSPTPQPTSESSPSSSPSPEPSPTQTAQSEPNPQPSPSTTEPTPSPSPTPSPESSPTPTPVLSNPEASPSPTPSPTPNPSPSPTETTTPESSPTPTPIPSPEPSPEPTPVPNPNDTPAVEPTPVPMPEPIPSPEPEPTPNPEESPYPDPEPEPTPDPSEEPVIPPFEIPTEIDPISPIPELLPPVETSELIENVLMDGQITPADAQAVVDSLMFDGEVTEAEATELIETLSDGGALTGAEEDLILDALSVDGEITQDEVNNLSETLSEDGKFTEAEKELVAEALIESADGEAVTVESIAEAGITLEDLPAEQPVEVRQDENGNEVVITAEVAVALELLTSAGDILSAVFESPAQLLFAIGNLGADMSPEERKEASETIIAATIVGNIATTTMATAIGSIGYRRPN